MTEPGGSPAPTVAPELQFSSEAPPVEMEPLFTIDGTVYSIPKKIRASVALEALEIVAESGEMVAAVVLFKRIMGEEAYKALRDCPGVDEDGLAAVMKVVQNKAMGQLGKLKGE